MFELTPEAKRYIVSLIRLRLDVPIAKISDAEIDALFEEIVKFVKGQFGF